MAKPSSRETSEPTGDYIIYVTEAYSLNSNWMPTARYYSGTVLFEAQSGKIHFTHVKRATLKRRMLHFCIPDNPTADAKARAAEHKRYVRALELYREYYRRTGQRYELVRETDRSLPYLPEAQRSSLLDEGALLPVWNGADRRQSAARILDAEADIW
ncbi:hypothetical protein [Phyllobacterium sp. UNC302MFCol5.2]|uniref:hypothetical protein n=1 Tax=Phyllobacterium sp. UNC302MFCol5.2 TaxID=1449065 RepID=UPI0004887D42|nr:hypothetical protein [Phyllobacterium sp. UNC302MFCol5.2]